MRRINYVLGVSSMIFTKPQRLYKYFSADGAKVFFENPSLWFRLPNQLNDIFDLSPIGAHPTDSFGSMAVFCLSETPASVPMWAHYGSQGEGLVLEFSMQSVFFCKYPPLKIRYRSKRPTIKNVQKALMTKDIAWSYEREWRCFTSPHFDEHKEQRFLFQQQAVSIPFPYEALTAVIYGYDSRVWKFAQPFLARPEASHVKEFVCRPQAWRYGLKICTLGDCSHIFEQREAIDWGRH